MLPRGGVYGHQKWQGRTRLAEGTQTLEDLESECDALLQVSGMLCDLETEATHITRNALEISGRSLWSPRDAPQTRPTKQQDPTISLPFGFSSDTTPQHHEFLHVQVLEREI